MSHVRFGFCLALGAVFLAENAAAQSDSVTAEALFQEGRSLLEQKRFSEACPKLAESQRLDPATGTLIALAACHELEGKLASAWSEFVDAEGRAHQEGRSDRETLAREHAAALKPRLSTLLIEVAPDVAAIEGLALQRDGVALGRGSWNTAVPIDGGSHVVDVSAPGRTPQRLTIAIKPEQEQARLAIPALALAPNAPAPGAAAATTADSGGFFSNFTTLQWAGVATAGAGVVSLGVGAGFLVAALGKKSDSESDCHDNLCGEAGLADRHDAVKHGNTATVFALAGGVLAATGVTLVVVGKKKTEEPPAAAALSFGVRPRPSGGLVSLEGAF